MKRITLNQLINLVLFLFILSLYLFTFQMGLNQVSNGLAVVLIGLIWLEMLLLRKKIVYNAFLFVFLLFIVICMISVFYAIDPGTAVEKVKTLLLVFILMFSLVNYLDNFSKIDFAVKGLIYSGLITSIYILSTSNFVILDRFGSELGNVNAIGMMIATSTIFTLYLMFKNRNYWYLLVVLTNLAVVLLTGSRKALLFIGIAAVFMLFFSEKGNWKKKLKYLLIGIGVMLAVVYAIINVPIFYEIIGQRMINMYNLLVGIGTTEGSINKRSDMILLGWQWFKERPLFGYGIDNYRFLYGSLTGGNFQYAHNNVIELLVGTGITGAICFYLANLIVVKDLVKASQIISRKSGYSLCFSFVVVIGGYILISIGLVYYYDKYICLLLAMGSVIYRLTQAKEQV